MCGMKEKQKLYIKIKGVKGMKARNYFYCSFVLGLLVALTAFMGNTIVWNIIAGCYAVIAIFDLFAAIRES